MGPFTFSNLFYEIEMNGLGESFLLPAIFNMSITASVVILFVLLARVFLKKTPKIFSYALWAVVLFRLLCPVSVTTGFSVLGLFDPPAVESTEYTTAVEYVPYDIVHTPDLEVNFPVAPVINEAVNEALPQEHAALGADPLEGEMAIASFVWLLGIGTMVLYGVVSYFLLRCKLVGAIPLRDNIYLADGISSPFVMGFFRPNIYLPSSLSEQEQTYIILHEQHHIRRLDHWIKALAFIALCIHWFNPLVWVSFVLSSKDMEMSCDEAVVKKLGEDIRADYSASLLSLATGRRIIAGTPLAFGEGDTKSRIKNMLNWKKPKVWITVVAAVVCVAVAVVCAANPKVQPSQALLEESDVPAAAQVTLLDFLNAYKDDPENASAFCHFETDEERDAFEKSIQINRLVAYEILEVDVLSDQLYAVKLHLTKESGDIPERYYFLGEYNEQFWVMININNVPVTLRKTIDPDILALYADNRLLLANSYGTAEDISYCLELSAIGKEFRDMDQARQIRLLVEYEDLLDNYTLIARGTTDETSAYIVGSYNGRNPEDSPLYGMYGVEVSTGEDEVYQLLYREENSVEVEEVLAASKKDVPSSLGYRIEDSWITWSSNSGIILIQPRDTELSLDVALNRYLYTPNGREYITDAASRGIDMCSRTDPFLYVYRIDQRFGELAERIPLTEAEAAAMLAEERVKLTDGFGFSATLHIDDQTTYYNEREGVPQSVLDLAVERCDYRFGDPSYITDTIREARLDCDWLDAPLYAGEEDLPRLREILKNAEQGYVGACGYGAKLTLTFTGGEKLTVFKGTDDCDTVVFGSYGGYFIGDKENTEFWEMFGLDSATKTRIETNPADAKDDVLQLFNESTWQGATFFSQDLAPSNVVFGSPDTVTKIRRVFSSSQWEHVEALESEPVWENLIDMYPFVFYDRDGLVRYGGPVRDSSALDEPPMEDAVWYRAPGIFEAMQEATETFFVTDSPLPAIPLSDAEAAAAVNAVLADLKTGWWTSEPLKACAYESAAFQCLYREVSGNLLTLYGYGRYARWNSSRSLVEDWGTAVIITMNANTLQVTDFWVPGDGAAYESDILESFPASIARIVAEPDPARYQEVRNQLLEVCRQTMRPVEQEQTPAAVPEPAVQNAPFTDQPISWDTPLNGMFERTYETQLSMLGNIDQTYPPFFKEQTLEFETCTVLLGTSLDTGTGVQSGTAYILYRSGSLGKLPLPMDSNGVSVQPDTVADNGNGTLSYAVEANGEICYYTVNLEARTVSMSHQPPAKVFAPADVEFTKRALEATTDPMTYADRLAWVQSGATDSENDAYQSMATYLEGNGCLAYLCQWVGTPHLGAYVFEFRFADGTTALLPLARDGYWASALPDSMEFRNGKFLYETTFTDELLLDEGRELIHLAGTYRYEVDLTAKTVSLTLL